MGKALQQGPNVDAGVLSVNDVLTLQRLAGNKAVAQLLGSTSTALVAPPAATSPSSVQDVVAAGGGSPLSSTSRQLMETRLGHDFSDVRLHTDAGAAASARSVAADAYTVGADIVLGPGHGDLNSSGGQRMLAHELTHVIQQRSGPVAGNEVGGGVKVSDPSDRFEREAERVAERVMANEPAGGQHGHSRDAAVLRVAKGPAPTGSVSAMPVVQRHASFEHRMLGDVPPADLFALGAHQEVEQSGGRSFVNIPMRGGRQPAGAAIEHRACA